MIRLININKFYHSTSEKFHALKDINLTFGQRGMHFIVGKSGSGKSTLLNIIGGIDQYDSGDLIIDDVSTKDFSSKDFHTYRNSYVGFVFQEFNVLKGLNVYDNIAISLDLQHKNPKEYHKEVQAIIDRVGLTGLEKRMMNQISGGERQRVAIARALIKNPRIIIADEPTGNLDSNNSKIVMDLLKDLSRDHLILIVTHNKKLANKYADRVLEIKDGRVISDTGDIETGETPLSLKPITTPIKTSFNLALKAVMLFKYRFIFMILLFALSLTFAGVVVNLSLADTTGEYAVYQKTYGNEYVALQKKYYNNNNIVDSAFFSFEYPQYYEMFHDPKSKMNVIKGMDFYIPIDQNTDPEKLNPFYVPVIQRIHLYEGHSTTFISGGLGNYAKPYAIIITDYLAENLLYQNYFKNPNLVELNDLLGQSLTYDYFEYPLEIQGILRTDYDKYAELKKIENQGDTRKMVAFTDSLIYYNSIFVTQENYNRIVSTDNIKMITDQIIYSVNDRVGVYDSILITTIDQAPQGTDSIGNNPTKPPEGQPQQMAVTTGFLKKVLGLTGDLQELYNYTNFKYRAQQSLEDPDQFQDIDVQTPFYVNGNGRIPVAMSFVVTKVIEYEEPAIYMPLLSDTDGFKNYLRLCYTDGGFITMIINEDAQINSKLYRMMLDNDIILDNQAFQKVILVDNFIKDNIWFFVGLFFVYGLYSVLFIFNLIIINIKHRTRDIGIYMSLGFSGFKIALIYFFQVIIMGLASFILSVITTWIFLFVLDYRFTQIALVDLKIIKMTFLGILTILGIATCVPTFATIFPLISLSKKHPIDVIKTN